MTTWGFFKRRIVRLHPMVIAGSVIAMLLFYFQGSETFPLVDQTPWWRLLMVFLIGITMIPVTGAMDVRGWGEFYPVNSPQWSLGWEYLANILYAFIIRRFSRLMLWAFVLFSALLTLNITLGIDLGGVMGSERAAMHSIVGGFGIDPTELFVGTARLFYPFFCGLLVSRMKWTVSIKRGFWWTSLLVVIVLVMPHVNGVAGSLEDGIYQSVCILLFFPFIVAMGAGSTVSGRSARFCQWLGRLSYPLYITHFSFVYLESAYITQHPQASSSQCLFVGICLFILSILTAQACLKLYDEPVREWLKEHWLKKPKTTIMV